VGPPSINVHDWEVCHRESQITVLGGCPDTFDQIVYIIFGNDWVYKTVYQIKLISIHAGQLQPVLIVKRNELHCVPKK
jgi:hypothetical protein